MTIKDLTEVMSCEDFNDIKVLNPDDEYLCKVKKFSQIPKDIKESVVLRISVNLSNDLLINVDFY